MVRHKASEEVEMSKKLFNIRENRDGSFSVVNEFNVSVGTFITKRQAEQVRDTLNK